MTRKRALRRMKIKAAFAAAWEFARGYLSFSKLLCYGVLLIDYKTTSTTLDLCYIAVTNKLYGQLAVFDCADSVIAGGYCYGAVFCPEQKQGRKHGGRYRVRNHTETGLLKGGKHMNEIILKRIGALLSVKSIVTLALTAVFAYLAVTKQISQEFMVVYTVVIAFYFGTQTQKISDAVESKGAQ